MQFYDDVLISVLKETWMDQVSSLRDLVELGSLFKNNSHISMFNSLKFQHHYLISMGQQELPFKMQMTHVNESKTLSDPLHLFYLFCAGKKHTNICRPPSTHQALYYTLYTHYFIQYSQLCEIFLYLQMRNSKSKRDKQLDKIKQEILELGF